MDVSSPAARALRCLQRLDEAASLGGWRFELIAAESALGELLSLDCTGEPSMWNADGSVAGYDHNGDTCPVHEWLVESDQHEVAAKLAAREERWPLP